MFTFVGTKQSPFGFPPATARRVFVAIDVGEGVNKKAGALVRTSPFRPHYVFAGLEFWRGGGIGILDKSSSDSSRRARQDQSSMPPEKKRRRRADLGRALRTVYDDTLREDVPNDFLDLLGKRD